jgi:hypothetical protein
LVLCCFISTVGLIQQDRLHCKGQKWDKSDTPA